MEYFTSDGRIVNYTKRENERISGGIQGEVYRYNKDECIKLYYDDEECRIPKENFELFKNLGLDNYCKLYDLLLNETNDVMGYTMKYYKTSDENILLMPVDYTLDNISSIYNSIMRLTDNGIIAKDLYYRNSIVTDNEIIIIDFDSCRFSNLSPEVLKEVNITNLHYLMKSLYIDAFKQLGINAYDMENDVLENNISILFKYTEDMPKTLTRKLSPFKRPIDLLYRKH